MSSPFLGIHHTNVQTSNLEQSVQFYTEVLGFSVLNRRELGPLKLVDLTLGGAVLELKEAEQLSTSQDGIIDHLAIQVDDMASAVELVKNQGVELISAEPRAIGPNKYCFFFRGPSGEKIELITG